MDFATKELSKHIKNKGIKLAKISSATGLSYYVVTASLSGERPLRAEEFLKICQFLNVDPNQFSIIKKYQQGKNKD